MSTAPSIEQLRSRTGTTALGVHPSLILVDAHVHLHPCFDSARFLSAAARNFQRAARRLGASCPVGVLLMTDGQDVDSPRRLLAEAASGRLSGWVINKTDSRVLSLECQSVDGCLLVIAGRQIVTAERLELLALCCDRLIPDGLPMADALAEARRSGALAVVPWGFGKWTGRRRRLVAELIRKAADSRGDGAALYLGDNGGRARLLPEPRLLGLARRQAVRILPGTDPLPLPWHARRAGSCGFVLKGQLDRQRPAEHLIKLLIGQAHQPRLFGRLQRLGPFCVNQVAMQLRKWQSRVRS